MLHQLKFQKERKIDSKSIKYIFKVVAEIILMLHEKNIYHTDIKPANMEFD